MSQLKLNFQHVRTLLVDHDPFTRGLVAQMLRGFGMSGIEMHDSAETALDFLKDHHVDLALVAAGLPEITGTELVGKIRRDQKDAVRHMPVLMMTGYSQNQEISAARDAGANMVVKKPLSPQLLFDRVAWIARTQRPFVETDDYVGPDRRFREVQPPGGEFRRSTDANLVVREEGVA